MGQRKKPLGFTWIIGDFFFNFAYSRSVFWGSGADTFFLNISGITNEQSIGIRIIVLPLHFRIGFIT